MMPAMELSMLTLVVIVQDVALSLELLKSDHSPAGDIGSRLLWNFFRLFLCGRAHIVFSQTFREWERTQPYKLLAENSQCY